MRLKYGVAIAATMLIGALTGGCGDGEAPSPLELATTPRDGIPFEQVVQITRSGYKPAEVRVLTGGKVTWINLDPVRKHTVETTNPQYKKMPGGKDASFDSHTLSWEEPYTATFLSPGTFLYTSSYDSTWKGEVTVVEREVPKHAR
jgi:plastocyanin